MVVWLFAGGGEAEVRGLVPFFERHFPGCQFYRKTPVLRKPGPRPGAKPAGYGKTGRSLVAEIQERLKTSLAYGERCDIILVIDDLDCRDAVQQRAMFLSAIEAINDNIDAVQKFIGFAAPELEAWIIADWDNSVAKHPDFRDRHEGMRHWLSTEKNVPFGNPESFSEFDPEKNTCKEKLSQAIIDSTTQTLEDYSRPRYSKAGHTPSLLRDVQPLEVAKKCPLFRELYLFLNHR
jgi:hypothetical protein